MKFEHTSVWGFEHAIRGARNPMNSWNKSDSGYECENKICKNCDFNYDWCGSTNYYIIGPNDMNLLQRLIKAGSEHRKFMRQIMVSVDMTAPMYIWSEFDTYKIGITANSTSKMHKLASTPITLSCFETDDYCPNKINCSFVNNNLIPFLEDLRIKYLETKDQTYWKELIRWLPESWCQTRTITMNYENLYSIVRQRQNHRLTEWKTFIKWVRTLPYNSELIFLE